MESEEKAQISLEYLLIIAAIITLVVVISLFIKNSILQIWLKQALQKLGIGLNSTG